MGCRKEVPLLIRVSGVVFMLSAPKLAILHYTISTCTCGSRDRRLSTCPRNHSGQDEDHLALDFNG